MVVDQEGALVAVNEAAEALFGQGLALLARGRFKAALPPDSALVSLINRALAEEGPVRERGVEITLFGHPPFEADGAAAPLGAGAVLLSLHVKSGALGVDRAGDLAGVRSVVGLGRMLAHEIKNPLAGIRGAAQLLKSGAQAADVPLAQLIMDETDRVRRLVDRMEAFSDDAPPERNSVNIHQVLDRVRALAANGVAEGLALKESYDPSLPPVWGEEDQLIQIFLNLVKNAAEAAPQPPRRPRRGADHHRVSPRCPRAGRRRQGRAGRTDGSARAGQRSRRAAAPARSPVRTLCLLQGKWRRAGPRPRRQACRRARRPDRLRIGARPHRVPRPPASPRQGGRFPGVQMERPSAEDPGLPTTILDTAGAQSGVQPAGLPSARHRQRHHPS